MVDKRRKSSSQHLPKNHRSPHRSLRSKGDCLDPFLLQTGYVSIYHILLHCQHRGNIRSHKSDLLDLKWIKWMSSFWQDLYSMERLWRSLSTLKSVIAISPAPLSQEDLPSAGGPPGHALGSDDDEDDEDDGDDGDGGDDRDPNKSKQYYRFFSHPFIHSCALLQMIHLLHHNHKHQQKYSLLKTKQIRLATLGVDWIQSGPLSNAFDGCLRWDHTHVLKNQ